MKPLILLLLALYSTNAIAVDFLPAGSKTANDGYLFSVPEEQKLRLLTQDNDYEKALNIQLTNQNSALQSNATTEEERIANLKTGMDAETKIAQDAQSSSTLRNALLFGGGLLVGLFSAYAASKALYHN